MGQRYLESIDSVRVPWGEHDHPVARLAELQVFSEALAALILGDDIVVPQPYAFDSYLFGRLAVELLGARDAITAKAAGTSERPLVLMLYGADSLSSAVTSLLSRTSSLDAPFHLSLWPDLGGGSGLPPAAELACQMEAEGSLDPLIRRLGPDGRRKMLETVWSEFGFSSEALPVRLVAAGNAAARPGLAALVRRVLDRDRQVVDAVETAGLMEAFERLGDWLRRLEQVAAEHFPPSPGPQNEPTFFNVRSKLRTIPAGTIAGRHTTQPALAALGGDEAALAQVEEFVDTLYNTVLAASYGWPLSTFSTKPFLDDADPSSVVAHELAQRVALASRVPDVAPGPDETKGGPADAAPLFEVDVQGGDGTRSVMEVSGPEHRSLVARYRRAFESVLELRSDPRFRDSRDALRAAGFSADRQEVDHALEQHLTIVARRLDTGVTVEPEPSSDSTRAVPRLKLTVAGPIAGTVVGLIVSRVAPDWIGLTLGAGISGGLPSLPTRLDLRRQRRADDERREAIALSLGESYLVSEAHQ